MAWSNCKRTLGALFRNMLINASGMSKLYLLMRNTLIANGQETGKDEQAWVDIRGSNNLFVCAHINGSALSKN